MTTFQAIVYGLVHAVTLWIPVSDQAHLWWIGKLMDWPEPSGVFLGAFFLGAALAGIVFYIHDWLSIGSSVVRVVLLWRRPNSIDERMPLFLLLTTAPWLAAKFFLGDWLATLPHEAYWPVATVAGLLLFSGIWAFAFQWNRQNKSHLSWNWADSLLAGLAQLCHLIPGAGRQVGFLAMANVRGYQREAIWKFAILSFTPTLALSAAQHFHDAGWAATESPDFTWLSWGVALVMSFFVSMLVLNAATQSAARTKHTGVTNYRVLLGIAMGAYVLLRL